MSPVWREGEGGWWRGTKEGGGRCRRKGKDVHFLRIFVLFIRLLSPGKQGGRRRRRCIMEEAPHTRCSESTRKKRRTMGIG